MDRPRGQGLSISPPDHKPEGRGISCTAIVKAGGAAGRGIGAKNRSDSFLP